MSRDDRVVPTVLGDLPADRLGTTLMHEHVVLGISGVELDHRYRRPDEQVIAEAVAALRRGAEHGLDTIVDATTIEMGRNPALLARVSELSGVAIVCSTGLYTDAHGIPPYFRGLTAEELADWYLRDLEDGIDGSPIRAGVIKVATSGAEPTAVEAVPLEAAAIAAVRSGAPIITHTSGGGGDRQAAFLLEHGVDPRRIVIGHVDHKDTSPRYLQRILRSGVWTSMDRVGIPAFLPDEIRAGLMAGLIDLGHAPHLLMSMDSIAVHRGPRPELLNGAGTPYVHLLRDFRAKLTAFGVAEASIERMLVENPRDMLARP